MVKYILIICVCFLSIIGFLYLTYENKINDLTQHILNIDQEKHNLQVELDSARNEITKININLDKLQKQVLQDNATYSKNIILIEDKYNEEIKRYKQSQRNATCEDKLKEIQNGQREFWQTLY